jgi:hypothetical protein
MKKKRGRATFLIFLLLHRRIGHRLRQTCRSVREEKSGDGTVELKGRSTMKRATVAERSGQLMRRVHNLTRRRCELVLEIGPDPSTKKKKISVTARVTHGYRRRTTSMLLSPIRLWSCDAVEARNSLEQRAIAARYSFDTCCIDGICVCGLRKGRSGGVVKTSESGGSLLLLLPWWSSVANGREYENGRSGMYGVAGAKNF